MLSVSSVLPSLGEILIIEPAENGDSEALFEQACDLLPDYRIEQDGEGSVLIMSPTGGNSSFRNGIILAQLIEWAARAGTGKVFESNVLFVLPNKSKRGPDAAWVSNRTLKAMPREARNDFLPAIPEFVIELRSKTDRVARLHAKMREWIDQGVQLGWLIDADERTLGIYRQGSPEPEMLTDLSTVHGEGPLAGFRLETAPIWRGLDD